MFIPRHMLTATFVVALSLCSYPVYGSPARLLRASHRATRQSTLSQDEEREQAIKLYQTGDAAGAVKALQAFVKKQSNDTRAWHYLGLALTQQGKPKDARKAHEKAARLAYQLISTQAQGADFKQLPALIAQIKPRLEEAADSADKYLELSSKPSKSKVAEWRERARALRDFIEAGRELDKENATGTIFESKEVSTRARILEKMPPQYTEEARQNQVAGTIVLLLILTADGQVRGFIPLASLPYGLTEEAIKVARQIRFVPAMKDGKAVSQFLKVEYNFNIY